MLFKNSGIRKSSRLWGHKHSNIKQKHADLAFAWEAQALFDALVFTLTVTRTLKMRKLHNMEISLSGKGLLDVFLRDGERSFPHMHAQNSPKPSRPNLGAIYFA
jgi:hypothetical protein